MLEEGVARADAHLRDVRSRFDAGLIPPNEVSSAEAQRSRQQMQLIEARNLRSSVVEELRRLTGITARHRRGRAVSSRSPRRKPPVRSAGQSSSAPSSKRSTERIAAADERVTARSRPARKPDASPFTGAVGLRQSQPAHLPARGRRGASRGRLGERPNWTLWDGGRIAAEAAEAAARRDRGCGSGWPSSTR